MNKKFYIQLRYGHEAELCDNTTFFPFITGMLVNKKTDIVDAITQRELWRHVVFYEITDFEGDVITFEDNFMIRIKRRNDGGIKCRVVLDDNASMIVTDNCELELV